MKEKLSYKFVKNDGTYVIRTDKIDVIVLEKDWSEADSLSANSSFIVKKDNGKNIFKSSKMPTRIQ
ncbi:MAG: hypothetical protein ACREVA_04595 [Burkholderiales bacterium]